MRSHILPTVQKLIQRQNSIDKFVHSASISSASWNFSKSCSLPTTVNSSTELAQRLSQCHTLDQWVPIIRKSLFSTSSSHCQSRNVFLPDKTVQSPVSDMDIPENVSIHEFVFDKCDHYKDLPALSDFGGRMYTYTQLKEKAIRVASALSRKGFKKGDIILVFSPNQMDYTVLMLASSCLGLWFSAANPAFTSEDLARQLHHSDCISIFVHQVLTGVADAALDMEGYPHKVKEKFVFGESSGYEPFQNLMENDGKAFPDISIDPLKDVFVLPYSSGTTGLPKGVMLSHHNVLANTLQTGGSFRYVERDNVLGLLPLYHIYGMSVIQFGTIFNGGHLHLLPKFEPESFLNCMQDSKINSANLVPPLVLFMTKHPIVAKFDLSALRGVVCGAAPLGKEITEAFLQRFDHKITLQQGYGLTETSPVTHIDTKCIPGSIGDLVCNTQAKLVNLESGATCGPNEEGELCIRGPQVMLGYYKNEAATREMIKEDGWLYTGDIAYYDQDGTFFICDRLKELIKYKGSQVAPAELEALLISHPDLVDACVVGMADERAGEVPKAFVVKKPDTAVTEDDIVQFVQDHVSDFKRLRGGVEFIQEIPKNPSGKILRKLLKT